MSTIFENEKLGATLFGKTRRAVLRLLYGHADESFYLRQIVRASGGAVGAVQRELKQLVEAGIVRRSARASQVYFQANAECPVFAELKSLVLKTAGVADVLRAALAPLAERIHIVLIYGSMARGSERRDSDVDVVVVGDVTFSDVVAALGPAQETLRREVNPTVYPSEEFASKVADGDHFVRSVLEGHRVFVVGDERELTGLAQERLAD